MLLNFLLLILLHHISGYTRKIKIAIPEQQQVGSHVANVIDIADLDSHMSAAERDRAKFQYFSSTPAGRFFFLDSKSGELTIRRPIDRDNLCETVSTCCPHKGNHAECVLSLSIRSDDEYRYVILTKIVVTDINDNSPSWPESELTVHFSEASSVGELRSLKVAKDPDSGVFSVQRYEMVPKMPQFALQLYKSKTPLTVNAQLKLKLTATLDREEHSSYEFRLIAYDGGKPARSGTVKVRVFVTDENDNNPVFEKSLYTAHLNENSPRYSSVILVTANDRDSGANGQVRYSFSTLTKAEYRRAFSIDSLSGLIRVQGDIDYERSQEMTLYVEAVDQGLASRTGMTTVSVRIHDENDHRPRIKVESATTGDLSHVEEEQTPPALLAVFSVADGDSGPNGQITCKAVDAVNGHGTADGTRYGLEKMNIPDIEMYKVLALSRVDREKTPYLRLGVVCSDAGTPALSSTTTLSVKVDDINDFPPSFGRSVIHQEVREDRRPGDVLFPVNATDPDEGDNGRLEYWLTNAKPGPQSPFAIHRVSGKVYLQQKLDRELVDKHSFVVYARDHGKKLRKTSSVTVSIAVIDANDHPPKIDNFLYVSVPENQTTGETITHLNATDADLGENAKMVYSMEPLSTDESGYFHLSPSGQLVLLRRGLDREKKAEYDFLVKIVNTAPPTLTATSTLVVTINDINDCSPEFRFPNPHNDTLVLWSSQKAGKAVARVIAVDNDINANGRVNYFIRPPGVSAAANTISSLFSLDPSSGDITLKRDLARTDVRMYHVLLEARDNGFPPQSTITVLKIKVVLGSPAQSPGVNHTPVRGRTNDNFIIIVILVSVTGVCASILIVAIVALLYRRKKCSSKDRRLCLTRGQNDADNRNKWRMDIMGGQPYTSTVDSRGSITEEREPLTSHNAMDGISPTYVSFINHDQLSLTSFDNSNDSGKGGSVDNNCQGQSKDEGACPLKSPGILKFQTFKDVNENMRHVDLTANLNRSSEHPLLSQPNSRGHKCDSDSDTCNQRAYRNSISNIRASNVRELSPICEQPCNNGDSNRRMNGYHTIDCARRNAPPMPDINDSPTLNASFV